MRLFFYEIQCIGAGAHIVMSPTASGNPKLLLEVALVRDQLTQSATTANSTDVEKEDTRWYNDKENKCIRGRDACTTYDSGKTQIPTTNSGQGSESLSDAFVAVEAERRSRKGTSRRMEVRWYSRVLARSTQASLPLVEAPSGGKCATGYKYEVLQPVIKECTWAVHQTDGSI
jgi:hypothetical protein